MITLIHGPDIFQAKQYISQLLSNRLNQPDNNRQSIDGSTISPENLRTILQPFQLFSPQTTLILKNPLRNKQDLSEILVNYLQQPHENITLIIWEQAVIDKRKAFYKSIKKNNIPQKEFTLPKKFQLINWLKDYCQQNNIQISPDALHLLSSTHENTYQLHQEVTKLKIFSDNHITVEDINKISPPSHSSIIFDLTDQIGQKSPQAYLTAKKLIDQGEYPPRLIATLATHIANLIMLKESACQNLSPKQIKDITKLHPFVIDKGSRQCRNFSLMDLKKIYQLIAQADIDLKTGRSDFDQSIYSIINFNQSK